MLHVFDPARQVHVRLEMDSGRDGLLYVPLPRMVPPDYLSHVFAGLPRGVLRECSAVVMRAHLADAERIERDATNLGLQELLSVRSYGADVSLLRWRDHRHVLEPLAGNPQSSVAGQAILKQLRQAELWCMVQRAGVLLPKIDDFHYQGPNGKHYRSFLRVGLGVQSPDELDAIAFWLLPFMIPKPIVVLDSWTILALGLNLHRYAQAHGYESAAESVFLDTLRHYDESQAEFEARLDGLVQQRLGSSPHEVSILCVTSVTSSGRLAERMREIASRLGVKRTCVVALFAAHEDTGADDVFCPLGEAFEGHEPRACEACLSDNPVIRIEKTNYLLEMAADARREAICEKHAVSMRDFFHRYRGSGAVSVHRTRAEPGEALRHHMIHLDLTKLITVPTFRMRLEERLSEIRPMSVDVIVCPTHQAARMLAAEVGPQLGCPVVIVDEEELTSLGASDIEALRAAQNILVVDDVVTSGDRIRAYKRRLHDIGAVRDRTQLMMLVGVSRTASAEASGFISDMLFPVAARSGRRRGQLYSVEEVILPDWNEKECPWCAEQRLLDQVAAWHGAMREWGVDRGRRLRDPMGLVSGLFLSWPQHWSPFVSVGPQSIFGAGLSCVELFAAVAGALQQMRSGGVLKEQAQPPMAYVISPDSYLTGRYYEDMIDAAIIRASRRHDLRTSSIEEELIAKVGRRIREPISHPLRGELALAIAMQKLPNTPRVAYLFGDPDAETGAMEFIRALLDPALSEGAVEAEQPRALAPLAERT